MDDFEAIVERFITFNGEAFACSQYSVSFDKKQAWGGTSPDFVVLDFKRKDLIVVEVSAASSIARLMVNVRNREDRWYRPIRSSLISDGAITSDWPDPRFIGFIREDNVLAAEVAIPNKDVCFYPLEKVAFPYLYWNSRIAGRPRRQ